MVYDLIIKNRTVRKFRRDKAPSPLMLKSFVASARAVASAANLQRLRYFIITEASADKVFSMIKLGGYLQECERPTFEHRPSAYIVVAGPRGGCDSNLMIDAGISAEAITLTAAEAGVGSCMIRSFASDEISGLMGDEAIEPVLVIALGYGAHSSYITDVKDGDIKYFIDESGNNAVPKRSLEELIVGII